MKSRLFCLWILLFILSISQAVFAQDTASITGTVTDPSGAAIANADVTVSSPERGIIRNTTTNGSGDFLVAGLPSGSVSLSVSAKGFKKYEAKSVVLRVGQKARNDVAMEVGTSNTEVTVEGTGVDQVDTQSSDLSGTVTGKEITQLQLNGRNFTQLVTLVPGVSNQTGQDEGTVGIYGNVSFSINGGRVEYNNWEVDGGDNMDNGSNSTLNVYPSIEAISEFKVLTSNYGAQYGRNGSGTVEVETKSGTSNFHGSAYEFVRNDVFNATKFPLDTVPPYKKNDFGYTIGGPIFIPKVYNTNKQRTFFFWSQEWRRDRVPGQDFNQIVPSVEERSGDFSDQCDPSGDMASCPVVPGFLDGTGHTPNLNVIPGFDPTAQPVAGLLSLISLPNSGSGLNSTFISSPTSPTNWREELIRVDHNFTDKVRGTFRYIHDSWDTIVPVPLWTNAGSFPTIGTAFDGPGVSVVARLNATFSPTLLNEFVFSYTTDHIVLNNTGNWQRPANFDFGLDLFPGNGDGIMPGINLVGDAYGGGFGQDAGYIPNGAYNSNPTYTIRDNVSKILGKHNLQFGFYAVFGQKNELGGELSAGSIPGYITFDPSSSSTTSGNPFADLLLGNIASFGQQDQRVKYYNRYKIFEPYFQDDWRITSRLTLNLGIRISLMGTYYEKEKQAYNFDPAFYTSGQTVVNDDGSVSFLGTDPTQPVSLTNLPNGIVQCGVTPGVPQSCMQGHLFNPAPRIGFAWDPYGNGKTAIRGGYGIFFEHANGNEGNTESLENSPPLATTVQQNNIVGYTGTGDAALQFPLSVTAIPTKAVWPYMQQWHFDIQQEIARNTVATISYVGSQGTHLSRQTNYNQLHPLPGSLNPYAPGEFIDTDSTSPTFNTDCNAPIRTVNGLPVTGQAAINLGVAACGDNPDPFRLYQGYGDINHLQFAASSTYTALQASLRHDLGGLNLSFAYTWSHSIDDASDRFDGSFVNSFDPSSNRANSNFDQRHILSFAYVWDLPFFKNPGVAKAILGGWQYSGIMTWSTGTPFSAVVATDNAGVANGLGSSAYADLVGDPNSPFSSQPQNGLGPQWYNPAAFALPRGLTFGTAGRNGLTNPDRFNFDMALYKTIPIKESMAFEFRAEAFNVFNHIEWGNIAGDSGSAGGDGNNTFPASNFTYIGSAHNARILQFALKFKF